jgi:hypothetical protein
MVIGGLVNIEKDNGAKLVNFLIYRGKNIEKYRK